MNRRTFLKGLTAGAAGLLLPATTIAEPAKRLWALDQTMIAPVKPLYGWLDPSDMAGADYASYVEHGESVARTFWNFGVYIGQGMAQGIERATIMLRSPDNEPIIDVPFRVSQPFSFQALPGQVDPAIVAGDYMSIGKDGRIQRMTIEQAMGATLKELGG